MSTTVSTDYWKAPTSIGSTSSSSSSSSTSSNSELDFQSFIQLLAAELQNQDPSDPVSSTEYVSQMAQISSLQQMENLSGSMDAYRAYSLIGKQVTYSTTDSSGASATATGTVQAVVTKDSATYLLINGAQVALNAVQSVSSTSA